jgi:hypothetical protein
MSYLTRVLLGIPSPSELRELNLPVLIFDMPLLMIVISASRLSNGQPKEHGTYRDQLDTVVGRESIPIASDPVSERAACTAQHKGRWLA